MSIPPAHAPLKTLPSRAIHTAITHHLSRIVSAPTHPHYHFFESRRRPAPPQMVTPCKLQVAPHAASRTLALLRYRTPSTPSILLRVAVSLAHFFSPDRHRPCPPSVVPVLSPASSSHHSRSLSHRRAPPLRRPLLCPRSLVAMAPCPSTHCISPGYVIVVPSSSLQARFDELPILLRAAGAQARASARCARVRIDGDWPNVGPRAPRPGFRPG